MDEPQVPETASAPVAQKMSLGARLTNVFVAPSEAFEGIEAGRPDHRNWIWPIACSILVGIVYTMVVFSQPAVLQNLKEAREKAMQKQVESKKMTQKQADDAMAMTEKFMTPEFLKAMGIIGCIVASGGFLFLGALIAWLIGRLGLHGQLDYMQAVEVVGLSTMISVLGGIVGALLAVIYGNPSVTVSPALLISHFDANNRVHAVLASLNVFTLWYIAVLSVGLAAVSGKRFWQAAAWLFGLWAFFTAAIILLFVGRHA